MVAALYAVACLWAAFVMVVDKERAVGAGRRVPEATLLFWAVFGWPGAKAVQRLWRHKTRKQPFARRLNVLLIVHAGFWAGAVGVFGFT